MNVADAIEKAHLVLLTYDDCIYDKRSWAEIVRALLPVAEAAMNYHKLIHPQVCGNPLPINESQIETETLHKLLAKLCDAATRS